MKKIITAIIIVTLIFLIAACGETTFKDVFVDSYRTKSQGFEYISTATYSSLTVRGTSYQNPRGFILYENGTNLIQAKNGYTIDQVICYGKKTMDFVNGSSGNVQLDVSNPKNVTKTWSNCNTQKFYLRVLGTASEIIDKIEVIFR